MKMTNRYLQFRSDRGETDEDISSKSKRQTIWYAGKMLCQVRDITSKYAYSFRKHNEMVDPILFSGLLFYLDITDKALNATCEFIEGHHRSMIESVEAINKKKDISVNMKDRMLKELGQMQQTPLFRIEDVMKYCDFTHSTATKMVNTFISLKIVKQVDDKQRYRVYEYIPLMECIGRI